VVGQSAHEQVEQPVRLLAVAETGCRQRHSDDAEQDVVGIKVDAQASVCCSGPEQGRDRVGEQDAAPGVQLGLGDDNGMNPTVASSYGGRYDAAGPAGPPR
jgi:hypothetical protein